MTQYNNNNALKHGAFSKAAIFPWESRDEFDELHDSIRMAFLPDDRLQDDVVLQIADVEWRKRRLRYGEALQAAREVGADEPESVVTDGAEADSPELTTRTDTPHEVQSSETGEQRFDRDPPDVIERFYDPERMLIALRAEAVINAQVAKLTTRLVMLKEYQRIMNTKQSEPKQLGAAPVAPKQAEKDPRLDPRNWLA
jgi:hypothetical protein